MSLDHMDKDVIYDHRRVLGPDTLESDQYSLATGVWVFDGEYMKISSSQPEFHMYLDFLLHSSVVRQQLP